MVKPQITIIKKLVYVNKLEVEQPIIQIEQQKNGSRDPRGCLHKCTAWIKQQCLCQLADAGLRLYSLFTCCLQMCWKPAVGLKCHSLSFDGWFRLLTQDLFMLLSTKSTVTDTIASDDSEGHNDLTCQCCKLCQTYTHGLAWHSQSEIK